MRLRLDETRKFGIEIEMTLPHRASTLATRLNSVNIAAQVEGYNHRLRSHWKITTDATVRSDSGHHAMELVSPPLKGRDGLRQLETVCAVLAEMNAKVNRSCGLHVHHDARDLDFEAWKLVTKCYVKYEDVIDQLMAPSRRGNGNQWCRSLRRSYVGNTVEEVFERIDRCSSNYDIQSIFGTRYVKLNLEASSVHGTIEFRHHHGTTNFTKIATWICLTQGFVTRSVAHKPVTLRSTTKHFDSLMWTAEAPVALRRYYWARYQRNGMVEGDESNAVEILDGRAPRQTRGPQARNRVAFEEAPVPAEDAILADVTLAEGSDLQWRIDVPQTEPVTASFGETYQVSVDFGNGEGVSWVVGREQAEAIRRVVESAA